MSETERAQRAADGLCDVTVAMEDVDLNTLLDDDVRQFLTCKRVLSDMTLRYRQDQRASARLEGETDVE